MFNFWELYIFLGILILGLFTCQDWKGGLHVTPALIVGILVLSPLWPLIVLSVCLEATARKFYFGRKK